MKTPDKSWTKKDFKIDWFSGSGAGGQHRNKHQNCCRVTHIESNITVTCQSYKERRRNFDEAFKKLGHKVVEWHYGKEDKERAPAKEVRRTYNEAENRITDHVTGEKTSFDIDDIDLSGRVK